MLKLLQSYILKAKNSKFYLFLLNHILYRAIPFNRPHRIKIRKIEENTVTTYVPYRRKNLNHIKGIHACCIATVAEFSAGLVLIKQLDPSKYRFIMANISVEYTYQAKTTLNAKSSLTNEMIADIHKELEHSDSTFIEVNTEIKDKNDKTVANCVTKWQLKDWSRVKTKL